MACHRLHDLVVFACTCNIDVIISHLDNSRFSAAFFIRLSRLKFEGIITKTYLFKYTENFITKN